jgi:hypothetical protein
MDRIICSWIPGMGKRFFSSPKHSDWLWGLSSLIQWVLAVLSSGLKCPVEDVAISYADVKNEWH